MNAPGRAAKIAVIFLKLHILIKYKLTKKVLTITNKSIAIDE